MITYTYFIILIFAYLYIGKNINIRHDEACYSVDCVYLDDYSLDFRNDNEACSINIPIPDNMTNQYSTTIYLSADPFIVC